MEADLSFVDHTQKGQLSRWPCLVLLPPLGVEHLIPSALKAALWPWEEAENGPHGVDSTWYSDKLTSWGTGRFFPLLTGGFYTSKRWLFGISEPSTVSKIVRHKPSTANSLRLQRIQNHNTQENRRSHRAHTGTTGNTATIGTIQTIGTIGTRGTTATMGTIGTKRNE